MFVLLPGFRCIKERCRTILAPTRRPNDQAHSPGSHLPTSPLRCRDHRAVRPLVHHLPVELPRSRGDDGRARDCRIAYYDSSLGDSLCARVREAMESLRATREYALASL